MERIALNNPMARAATLTKKMKAVKAMLDQLAAEGKQGVLVGENGPEVFVPDEPGLILPNQEPMSPEANAMVQAATKAGVPSAAYGIDVDTEVPEELRNPTIGSLPSFPATAEAADNATQATAKRPDNATVAIDTQSLPKNPMQAIGQIAKSAVEGVGAIGGASGEIIGQGVDLAKEAGGEISKGYNSSAMAASAAQPPAGAPGEMVRSAVEAAGPVVATGGPANVRDYLKGSAYDIGAPQLDPTAARPGQSQLSTGNLMELTARNVSPRNTQDTPANKAFSGSVTINGNEMTAADRMFARDNVMRNAATDAAAVNTAAAEADLKARQNDIRAEYRPDAIAREAASLQTKADLDPNAKYAGGGLMTGPRSPEEKAAYQKSAMETAATSIANKKADADIANSDFDKQYKVATLKQQGDYQQGKLAQWDQGQKIRAQIAQIKDAKEAERWHKTEKNKFMGDLMKDPLASKDPEILDWQASRLMGAEIGVGRDGKPVYGVRDASGRMFGQTMLTPALYEKIKKFEVEQQKANG